ncbi:hypothetical protein [Paraburkholderia antibiotica]|uniref:Uncharacterized protein n=1 Tax=Paraburkholderia antibiotica TaxID=2728839 RepID=A0A7X9X4K6_9BURK|nr:hypothetical protein [Paraburkholderia antibiotica]NML31334.1 hypothetical protein [Paraburkholderia antibiotica]
MNTPRRPSLLGDAEIEQTVREFAARVLFLRAAWHAGKPGAENPLEAIERDARALSNALKLTPYGSAYWSVLLPDETKHTGDPGAGLGLWVAGQVIAMMQAIEGGESEATIKSKLETMLADVVARLTGRKY